jgi:poly [ADP-ribose] polymerase
MSQEAPKFGCEYAKSDRSQCKLCKTSISMGSLRLAIYVQSPFFDGKVPNWYHFNCFFKKAVVTDTCFIKSFDSLRWEDQQKINEKLGIGGAPAAAASSSTPNEPQEENSKSGEFSIEYAKSNRSKCKKCQQRIEKNLIRINAAKTDANHDGWYHLECFSKFKSEFNFNSKPEEIVSFNDLTEPDQDLVKKSIGSPVQTAHKRKLESKDEDKNDDETAKKAKNDQLDTESKLKLQSMEYWKLRDTLEKEVSSNFLKELIEDNDQVLLKMGRDDLVGFVAEMMLFGPTKRCLECKQGQLVYKGNAYYCHGNITEWTKCAFKTQTPTRVLSLRINEGLREEFDFLKKFKFKPQERIFAKSLAEIASERKEKEQNPNLSKPLYNLNFALHGKLTRKNDEIKVLLARLGARVVTQMNAWTIALISNEAEVDKMNKKMREAVAHDIHVIGEAFLDEIKSFHKAEDLKGLILKHCIHAGCGSDLETRIALCAKTMSEVSKAEERVEKKFAIKSLGDDGTGKVKMKIKGGAVVDPDSGLEDEAHILSELKTNDPYSCVLGFVDIMQGTNSYYKLQIIEHDSNKKYFLFRSWGRVGTTIGGKKLEQFARKEDAIGQFHTFYKDKTGNEWHLRKSSSKIANKFYPLEMDYGDDADDADDLTPKMSDKNFVSNSSLAKPIQSIIRLIFDIESMKKQMKEFEIDLNKMPLGKISSNQIKKAFRILNDLNDLIDKKNSDSLIIDASNQFYTLIPHDFGMKKPTILSDSKLIKNKCDMLNNLLDIEIAYNILKADDMDKEEDPIDMHYKKLNCNMATLDHESDEFKMICKYVKNTHAATHSYYDLIVEEVLKVDRPSDAQKYESKFKSLHNRKLLWHGSRITNFAGILSQGLRIAPPEAPCTGYMFGKGVYFADMVSKSANYCFASSGNPTGLLLLCEVALGDMYERNGAEYVTKLPDGKQSTKGCGRTEPSADDKHVTPDGLEIPYGKGTSSGINASSLLYNEYIVYDTAQVNMKYLLKVRFDYHS